MARKSGQLLMMNYGPFPRIIQQNTTNPLNPQHMNNRDAKWNKETQSGTYPDKIHHGEMKINYDMNNTQQAGETANPWPFIGYAPGNYQNTCRICNKDMIADKLCFMCLECAVISAKGYIGNLESQLDRLPTPAPDAVEAKSAGVWVNDLRRLLESETVKALLRFAYKNPMRSGMDDFEGKEYIELYHFDTSVMQPSSPTSHAEGENVSRQIIDHLEILRQHINGRDLGQTQNEHNSMLAGVSYQLSEIIKQHGAVADAEGEKGAVWFAEERRPKIVCYCGSLRKAKEAFMKAEYDGLMRGEISLLPCCMFVDIEREYGAGSDYKLMADRSHKDKIALCDEIFVLNVGGYIGESTRSEIEYAKVLRKPIKYLEPIDGVAQKPAIPLIDNQATIWADALKKNIFILA